MLKDSDAPVTFPDKYHLVSAMIQDEAFIWEQVALVERILLLHKGHLHGSWSIRYLITSEAQISCELLQNAQRFLLFKACLHFWPSDSLPWWSTVSFHHLLTELTDWLTDWAVIQLVIRDVLPLWTCMELENLTLCVLTERSVKTCWRSHLSSCDTLNRWFHVQAEIPSNLYLPPLCDCSDTFAWKCGYSECVNTAPCIV